MRSNGAGGVVACPKPERAPKAAPKRLRVKPSPLTAAQKAVRTRVAARSGGACEIGEEGVCLFKASHFHHRLLRKQGGKDSVENLLHVCAFQGVRTGCHEYIHANPEWSYAHGYLLRAGVA